MIVIQMIVHETNVKNTLGAVFTLAWLKCIVLELIEMGLQVSKEERTFHMTDSFVIRQDKAFQTVRTEVMQSVCMLLFIKNLTQSKIFE